MPQGWNQTMEDTRSVVQKVENMQLQWAQRMREYHLALRDLEDVQKRDGRTMSSALEFLKRMEHHDRDAPKQTKIDPSIGPAQQQSSIGLGQSLSQPVVPRAQPAPHAGPYPDFAVDGLVISPYSSLEPVYSLAHIIGMVILSTPDQRLTCDHIYHWIRDSFGFYRQKGKKFRASVSGLLWHTLDFERMLDTGGKEGSPRSGGGIQGIKGRTGDYWKVRPDRVAKITETVWPIDVRPGPIMEMSRNGHLQHGFGNGCIRARPLDTE